MTEVNRAKILDKLAKLQAHEKSARQIGNFNEAEVFAAKISAWLLEYAINEDELKSLNEDATPEPVDISWVSTEGANGVRKQRVHWVEQLGHVIAHAHFCSIMVDPHSEVTRWGFVGEAKDREICVYLFTYLSRTIAEYVDYNYRRQYNKLKRTGRQSEMYGWRESFVVGAVTGLRDRFKEVRDHFTQTHGTRSYALVQRKQDNPLVKEFIAHNSGGQAAGLRKQAISNTQGYRDGLEFARQVEINKSLHG